LLERADCAGRLRADRLERWLLGSGFAVVDGAPGLLRPTALGREVGRALALVDLD
jgi:hypothetical protein